MSLLTPARPSRLLAAALALTAVLAGSGCGAFDTPEVRPCAWLDRSSDDANDAQERTIVLVDRSPSARPDRTTPPGDRVPDWATTVLAARELAPPALEGGILSVAGFDGTRATVSWAVDRVFVTPVKGNDTLKKDRRDGRRDCLRRRLRQLAAEAPSTDRTDVLGALAAADDQLISEGGRRRIVVATDGLTNTGCADLRSAGFDGTAEIKEAVERCRKAGELPDLTGAEVTLVGIGHAARGEAPSSPQTAWLAQSALDDAARRINDLDPVSVAISGHTDSRGSEQHGRQLSLARARAVRSALAERGITVASARGYSDDRPSCTPEYHDGVPDYAAMACNRRVEITVTVRR